MKLTIVTPTFNAAASLERCMDSISDQGVEHVIADGGSTDDTVKIIEQVGTDVIRKFVSEIDHGIYDGMNKGVRLATGDWIGIINADDRLAPKAAAAVREAVEREPDADIIHGRMVFVDEATGLAAVVKKSSSTKFPLREQVAFHPAMFVKRSVYEELGGYDLAFPIAADWEFMVRAVRAGKRFVQIDDILAIMYGGGAGSLRPLSNRGELLKMVRKHHGGFADYRWLVWEFLRDIKGLIFRHLKLREWSVRRADMLRTGGYQDLEEIEAMLQERSPCAS